MEILILLLLTLLTTGCDKVTLVDVITLETDTYISTADLSDHSETNQLLVSKSQGREDRAIVKFPTGKDRTYKDNLDQAMSSPVGLLLFPFFITDIILAAILDCQKSVIQPANLTDSKLVFEVLGNASNNSLTNHLQIQLLSKPWWQKADWNYSYPFSQKGRWSSAGGDIDTTFTPILSTHTGTTIEFGITTYFKSLISNLNTVHYGLLVSTPDATLDSVQLASVQYVSTTQRPKIVSTYTGSCTKSSSSTTQRVFYLSNPVETSK